MGHVMISYQHDPDHRHLESRLNIFLKMKIYLKNFSKALASWVIPQQQ
jgi:hypothetical protein